MSSTTQRGSKIGYTHQFQSGKRSKRIARKKRRASDRRATRAAVQAG